MDKAVDVITLLLPVVNLVYLVAITGVQSELMIGSAEVGKQGKILALKRDLTYHHLIRDGDLSSVFQ